ncbi:MAG: OmpA family protein [Alphaproteobacteria bacterium]|nr:OmpA family protein [Alphaproteobacteria bacterium]
MIHYIRAQDSIAIKPLPSFINSNLDEYYPFWSDKESTLYFTRRTAFGKELSYRSTYDSSFFKTPFYLELFNNVTNNQGALTKNIFNSLVFIAADIPKPDGFGNYDLYVTSDSSLAYHSFINVGNIINTHYWESSPAINPQCDFLIFSSNRPGGVGAKDLYYCKKNSFGYWQKPVNFGTKINSIANDYAPFIYADNKHIFFCSSRKGGYGGEDIYMFTKEDTNFSAPILLDSPINSSFHDQSFVFKMDGTTALLSSNRLHNNLDIYEINFWGRKKIVPQIVWFEFKVYNKQTFQKILPKSILIFDSNNNNLQLHYFEELELYGLAVEPNQTYNIKITDPNFWDYDSNYLIKNSNFCYQLDSIALEPIKLNDLIVWEDIHFKVNAADIDTMYIDGLKKLANFLKLHPNLSIEIQGHTDSTGQSNSNLLLSFQRATSVVDFLIKEGIGNNRLQAIGYGETRPKFNNLNENFRKLNRRIEIKVVNLNFKK